MTSGLRRKFLFASLYFSEGAPIGFLWWALPTRLRASGLDVSEITGLLGILVLPWAFKFLGAPFIDVVRSPRWPLRAWIATCQILMGLFLLPTLLLDWRADFALIATLLILHAFSAATQDVAVDAYALSVVPVVERGSVNAWMQTGMLIGRSIFGGGALLLDARVGPNATIVMLVIAIWSTLAMLALAGEPEPARSGVTVATRRHTFVTALQEVLRKPTTWLVLVFAAIGGAGFESVGLLVGPYLLDRGFSSQQIGGFLFLPTVAAMILGALVAGRRADRFDRRREAGLALVLLAATILTLAALAAPGSWLTLALLALLYFFIGAFTTASYALFMDMTDRRLGATQLSAYMSATNLCESGSAFAVGALVTAFGYGPAFSVMAMVSLVGLPVLWLLPRRGNDLVREGRAGAAVGL
ncbi:MAG TPA: MFS transporter [Vicinamibacterales bacterium]|nr:MFS transporter [Vicinamibacterales bacterium]